eukprot:scaffold6643_cov133-Isochrysis_galbana.AAC.4
MADRTRHAAAPTPRCRRPARSMHRRSRPRELPAVAGKGWPGLVRSVSCEHVVSGRGGPAPVVPAVLKSQAPEHDSHDRSSVYGVHFIRLRCDSFKNTPRIHREYTKNTY